MIKKEILITEDNLELRIKEFLTSLKEDYFKFNQEWINELNDWNNITKNKQDKEIGFIPEKFLLRSPITILNAPWGTGKTHFIETMGKMILKEKINEEELSFYSKDELKFKISNFIIIDMWKICNYENVVEEIFQQIISKILPLNEEFLIKEIGAKKWPKIKNWIWALPSLIKGSLGFSDEGLKASFELDLINFSQTKDILKENQIKNELIEVKNIINELVEIHLKKDTKEKTLIFFDNIERLGPFAWEVIKIIQNLQELNNLIIVFAMNKNRLVNQSNPATKDKYFESHMEKYLNMDYYDLQQDYLGVLKKLKIKNEDINVLNNFFNEEISGKKISIREMKKIIQNDYVVRSFSVNQIFGLKSLIKIIYGNYSSEGLLTETSKYLEEFIKEKLEEFLSFTNNLAEWQTNMFNHVVWHELKFPYMEHYGNDQLSENNNNILKNISYYNNSNEAKGWNAKMLNNVTFDWVLEFEEMVNLLDLQLKNCLDLFEGINEIESTNSKIKLEIENYKEDIDAKGVIMNDFKGLESPTTEQIEKNSINQNTIVSTQKIILSKENIFNQNNQDILNIKRKISIESLFWEKIDEKWTKKTFEYEFSNNLKELNTFLLDSKSHYIQISKNINNEGNLILDLLKNHKDKFEDKIIDTSFINDENVKNILEYIDSEFEKYQ